MELIVINNKLKGITEFDLTVKKTHEIPILFCVTKKGFKSPGILGLQVCFCFPSPKSLIRATL